MTSVDFRAIVQQSPDFAPHEKYYWGYQYQLSREVLVPELIARGAFHSGDAVAEIGCGEAGVLHAFIQAGATKALGTDIATFRLEIGEKLKSLLKIDLTLSEHDILFGPPKEEWRKAYDLVLLRDVIEHLDDAGLALRNIRNILKPGGWLFVTFPPYNSPYGGHQHLLKNFWGRFPYVHLLPKSIFLKMIQSGDHPRNIEEVARLKEIRLSANAFLKAAQEAGYEVVRDDYYLLRPVFKMKFGLPTIRISAFKHLPFVKSFLSLEAAVLLRLPK